MTNPHCRPPVPFGKEQPDGSVVLDKAEAVWLRTVFSRIDIAQSEVAISDAFATHEAAPGHLRRRMLDELGHHASTAVTDDDVEVLPRTKEDKDRLMTKHRAKLTIIRGGLPPRPAF